MLAYAITSATGWLMLVLLLAIILYPFLLRSGFLGPVQPFLRRMRLHYWLGYTLGGALLIHIWFSMSGLLAAVVNTAGLYLATVAMFLVTGQLILGQQLSSPKLVGRRGVRRGHFWTMLALVAFTLAHVALDSSTIQLLLAR